ncbi:MAG: septation protein SepH, partial [Actinomycetota bacterium]
MRTTVIKLKLVGASTDLEHLVFSAAAKKGKRGSHVAAIDDKLFRVLEDVVRKRKSKEKGEPAPKKPSVEPKLPPREVQRLLRAGRSVEQVARSAGMDARWVQRFLGPVLDERTIAIQDLQKARLEKPRLGISGVPLGESVVRNMRARRVKITEEELADAWDASRVDGAPWTVTLTFTYRGRQQRAVWRYDPHRREVTSANRLGSDLGWVSDARRARAMRAATAKPAARPKKTARKPAARRKTATRRKPAARRKTATRR